MSLGVRFDACLTYTRNVLLLKYLLGDAKYWRIFGRASFFQEPTVG
eukprot:SAG11_NODE_19631_length_462_cov_1.223140_1_plen_45_part_10